MAITLFTTNGQSISIEDNPFAQGGEGKIHKIVAPHSYRDCCVKMYDPKYRTPTRQAKIEFLIQHRPAYLQNSKYMVCFPQELVFTNNLFLKQFAGFIMPLAFKESIQLEALCTPNIRPVYKNHQRFDRKLPEAFKNRLQLCLNLAVPVHLVHSLGQYVFVDIKPQNILVSPDSRISIIDIDSIQISYNKQILYPAQVNTPEYSPPEWWNVAKDKYISEAWDRFSVAVIFYQILFGIHPYAATFKSPYANINEIPEKIKNGLFVHGHNSTFVSALPPPHQTFIQLDPNSQALFKEAFEVGLWDISKRPTIDQWGQAFSDALHSIKPVKNSRILAPIKPKNNSPQSTLPMPLRAVTPPVIYGGFWRRLIAFLLDLVFYVFIVCILMFTLTIGLAKSGMDERTFEQFSSRDNLSVICFLIFWLYFSILESSSKQGTVGKWMLGIQVTDLNGKRISFGKATGRFVFAFILYAVSIFASSDIMLGIAAMGSSIAALTPKRQALHDLIAECLIVRR
jgi:uncharacterized RDD family membrane protein YckC